MPRPPRFLSSRPPYIAGFLLLLLAGCGGNPSTSPPPPQPSDASPQSPRKVKLRIAAASDLKFAFEPLSQKFREVQPEIELEPTFGSSGTFVAQILQGAPFDLFLSADENYPKKLVDEGQTLSQSPFRYAQGHLVLWVSKDSPLPIDTQGLKVLTDPQVKKIAVANPKTAPYGRAAEAALRHADLWNPLQPKIVLGENASQATQFAESGNADVGLLPLSHALSEPLQKKGRYWIIPVEFHPPIIQAGVILKPTQHNAPAMEFQTFLLSPAGQEILSQFGLKQETP